MQYDRRALPSSPLIADKLISTLDRFLHIEALSGVALVIAAVAALIWANGPFARSYHDIWHLPITIGVGDFIASHSLHFYVNEGLMTIFFLVVGLEIRREIHDGALATLKLAALPLAAALGGVAVPATIYALSSSDPRVLSGWAVPTATDIAFAVGILALLGKSVPANVRVLLLALAVIDDIAAIIIIALFYSSGIQLIGFAIALVGVALVFGFQRAGVRSAWLYIIPGSILWIGLLRSGVHPTLAGVALGLLTPVKSLDLHGPPHETAARTLDHIGDRMTQATHASEIAPHLRTLRDAQREIMTPVTRVEMALHPWVAFVIMPLFALANAGVAFDELDVADALSREVAFGTGIALVLGKPIGVLLASWLLVRVGWGQLPEGVTWKRAALVGCLAGIGFTMAIFIANLAFDDPDLLGAAKLGILVGSATAALLGLALGFVFKLKGS